ncbi:hypothetical protein DSO57_1008912 [Entomophthora muscae]|nr:hypothetical protein DSO57_1008912 [Entomophthora muscae]
MYLDHDRYIYNFFQLPRVSKLQAIRSIMQKQTRRLYSSLKNEFGANLHGDALQTGGIFVINCKGRVLYACPQSDIAVFTDLPLILEICRKEFTRRTFNPVPAFTEALKMTQIITPKERPKRHSLAVIPSYSSSPTTDTFSQGTRLLRNKVSIKALKK